MFVVRLSLHVGLCKTGLFYICAIPMTAHWAESDYGLSTGQHAVLLEGEGHSHDIIPIRISVPKTIFILGFPQLSHSRGNSHSRAHLYRACDHKSYLCRVCIIAIEYSFTNISQ